MIAPARRRDEQDDDERRDHADLGRAEVERLGGHRAARVLVEDRRDQPQHVHRGEHDRDRADDGPAPADVEDAVEDEELGGERGRAGTASAITQS